MAASITDKFKKEILDGIWRKFFNLNLDSGGDSDRFYIGIGRSEEWPDDATPPTPTPSTDTVTTFQTSLQGVKRVSDLSYVIPRYNWSAGSIYSAYDDTIHSDTTVGALQDIDGPFYVITDEHNVYVCLQQGKTDEGVVRNSLYKPTDVSGTAFSAGPDGYLWRFMYNVGTYNARRYLTSEWLPVERILDSSEGGPGTGQLSASRAAQKLVQLTAVPGQILGIAVDSGGTGYSSTPTIKINGSSVDSAEAYARVDANGKIFQIVMKESEGAQFDLGQGYDERAYITVTDTTGSGAVLRPIVHLDSGGMGYDARLDLNASALMFSARIIGDEYSIFNVNNDFRQVGLIMNPYKDSANDSVGAVDGLQFDGVRGSALRKIYVGAGIDDTKTDLDNTVTGQTSGAKAILNYYTTYVDSDCCDSTQNTSHNVLYVHQSETTGYGVFENGEAVVVSDGAGTATIIAHNDSDTVPAMRWADVDAFTGKVLYVDNRVVIDRDEDQTEDIKIVIDL